jgi:hypothetical protein
MLLFQVSNSASVHPMLLANTKNPNENEAKFGQSNVFFQNTA